MISCHAGGAAGDRSQRPVPGHLQHEEEGDGELTEGNCVLLVRLNVTPHPSPPISPSPLHAPKKEKAQECVRCH